MKSLIFFEKSCCNSFVFVRLYIPFSQHSGSPHETKTLDLWKFNSLKSVLEGFWPGRDATVEKLVPGNIKNGNLTREVSRKEMLTHLFDWEFDSGSERTLAAWIRHASRTGFVQLSSNMILYDESGGRARTIWAICPYAGDNLSKEKLKPNVASEGIFILLKGGTARPPA